MVKLQIRQFSHITIIELININSSSSISSVISKLKGASILPEQEHETLNEVSKIVVSCYLSIGRECNITENLNYSREILMQPEEDDFQLCNRNRAIGRML